MNIIAMGMYLIRAMIIGVAVGVLYIRCGLFSKMGRTSVMLIGIASSPMFLSFLVYLLGLFFIGWQSWFYYVTLLAIAFFWIIYSKNYLLVLSVIREGCDSLINQVKSLGEGYVFLDLIIATGIVLFNVFCFSSNDTFNASVLTICRSLNMAGYGVVLIMGVSIFGAAVHVIRQMIKSGVLIKNLFVLILLTIVGCGLCLGLSLNGRPTKDADRSHYEIEARYFAEDKNSWEIDNYTDEKYGSALRDDHGPFWVVNLSDAHMIADMLGIEDPIRITNICIVWDYMCFQILLFVVSAFMAKGKKAGVLALCLFNFYEHEATLMLWGSRDAFRFVGLLLLLLYVFNLFDEIVGKKTEWYKFFFMSLFCYFSIQGHEGNACIMLGMFILMEAVMICCHVRGRSIVYCSISILAGSLLGVVKTILLYISTKRIDSSTGIVFHDTPVIEQIAKIDANRGDWKVIWASYSKPVLFVIAIGIMGLVALLIIAWKYKERETFIYGIIIVGMLLPLTGVFDWIGYEFSIWFIEQLRYRMYFLMLFSITGAWIIVWLQKSTYFRHVMVFVVIICLCIYQKQEYNKYKSYPKEYIDNCNTIVKEYKEIAEIVEAVSEGDAFVYSEVLLYYLKGTPKLLFHLYSEELIQAKTDEEIQSAVDKLNIGAIILPESGLEYHDYSLLPFWRYINESEEFGMITQEERGGNQDYVIYYRKNKED